REGVLADVAVAAVTGDVDIISPSRERRAQILSTRKIGTGQDAVAAVAKFQLHVERRADCDWIGHECKRSAAGGEGVIVGIADALDDAGAGKIVGRSQR